MNLTQQSKVIIDHNPSVLSFRMQELILAGWVIDPQMPLTQLGFLWEIGFVRSATDQQITLDEEEASKPSRADILKKARDAKAAKAVERQLEGV